LVKLTKTGENIPNYHQIYSNPKSKYTNFPKVFQIPRSIPNGCKIDQINVQKNIPTSSIAGPSKNYPNFDFLFENIPSGNPVWR
jgi:hypothetical protein